MKKHHHANSYQRTLVEASRNWMCTALGCIVTLLQFVGTTLAHSAEQYPERPITLVIPYGAKSDTQRYGEILAKYAKKHFNNIELVLENRVGDSGAKAAAEVKLMKSDGYSLFLGRVGSQAIAPALKPQLTYRYTDFALLGMVEIDPMVCAVRADSPYKTHRDLTQAIRRAPSLLRFGHTGPGTVQNLTSQYFMKLAGLKLGSAREVGYNGGPEMVEALLAGQIDFMCSNATSMVAPIQAGKMRGLFTTAPGRIEHLPQLQNAREVGLRDMSVMLGWTVLLGPGGLPAPVIARWKAVLKAIAKDPQWIAEMTELGAIPAIGTTKDNEKFIREQFDLYDRLVPTLGLRE
jgi:tripartite-type tricarboxylate transporter receptor subunit TctC